MFEIKGHVKGNRNQEGCYNGTKEIAFLSQTCYSMDYSKII